MFKLTFINNEVVSCKPADSSLVLNGHFHYEHNNGKLIYALVKAENEQQALELAALLKIDAQSKAQKAIKY